jgi:Uma2 family endonuclease
MVLAESKTISFDDFITWLPEKSPYRYELRDGEILEMPKPRIQSPTFPELELSIDLL